MPLYQVLVYAIVQGLAEFLPISSSAHLEVLPRVMGWTDPGLEFDIALHIGTLIAVLAYFAKDWIQIVGQALGLTIGTDEELKRNKMLLWLLVAGTIPGAIAGVIFKEQAENEWRNLILIGCTMIFVGLLMGVAEKVGRQKRDISGIAWIDAIIIGVAQAFAIVPGVSRSGITITTGLFRSFTRESAARFSFLLSTPLIAGSALLPILKFRKTGGIPHDMQIPFALGIVVSGLVGAVVIAFFLRYIKNKSLMPFVYYRVIFGIMVIALALYR